MKTAITAIAAILLVASTASYAYAEVPDWVKNNAGWWADGTISETEFLSGIEFLIKRELIQVTITEQEAVDSEIPDWVRNNAGWWSQNLISDEDYVAGIEYLIKRGIVSV